MQGISSGVELDVLVVPDVVEVVPDVVEAVPDVALVVPDVVEVVPDVVVDVDPDVVDELEVVEVELLVGGVLTEPDVFDAEPL